jgi:hypothetical protein
MKIADRTGQRGGRSGQGFQIDADIAITGHGDDTQTGGMGDIEA